ncbi:MAG TPA: bifunctional nuclease family protein [Planktothrix sp.]
MNQMFVAGIGLEGKSGQPLVLLNDQLGQRVVPIAIGLNEAKTISKAMQGVRSKRPDTHELLKDCVSAFGFEAHHVFIDCGPGDTYAATIALMPAQGKLDDQVLEFDARPSDAITVALMYDAPIMMSDQILKRSSVALVDENQDIAEFKDFVQNVKASDFNKFSGTEGQSATE